jgi:hypothetical protein
MPSNDDEGIIDLLMRIVMLAVNLACLWFIFLSMMFGIFDPRERTFRDSTYARDARDEAELYRQDSIRQEQERLEKNRKHEAFLHAVQHRKDSIRRFDSARIGYFLYRLDSVREVGMAAQKDSARARR